MATEPQTGQNGAVHYHEAFWLIVGGAAPIVILAVVVSTRDLQMVITLNVKLMISYRFLERSYIRASLAWMFSLLIEVCLFLAAMYSLAVEKDVLPPVVAMWAALLGIGSAVMLPYLAFQLGVARRRAADEQARADEQVRADPDPSPEPAERVKTADQSDQSDQSGPKRAALARIKSALDFLASWLPLRRRPVPLAVPPDEEHRRSAPSGGDHDGPQTPS